MSGPGTPDGVRALRAATSQCRVQDVGKPSPGRSLCHSNEMDGYRNATRPFRAVLQSEHTSDVVGDGCNHPFSCNSIQAASAKLLHASLCFQDPKDRFYHRLPASINLSAFGCAQLLPNTQVFRVPDGGSPDLAASSFSGIEFMGQIV